MDTSLCIYVVGGSATSIGHACIERPSAPVDTNGSSVGRGQDVPSRAYTGADWDFALALYLP